MRAKNSLSTGEVTRPLGLFKSQRRVLLVDDHPTLREGLMRVIGREADLEVCGEAGTAPEALRLVESSNPDLVLLDISLGDHNGIELTQEIVRRHRQLVVLVHSMHENPVYAQRSLRAGAKGYVAKSEPPENLLKAIRLVLRGEVYLNAPIAKQLLRTLPAEKDSQGVSPFSVLSQREFHVFEMMGKGLVTGEIAAALRLSRKTVQAHRDHIREKLQFKDAATLLRYAIRWHALPALWHR